MKNNKSKWTGKAARIAAALVLSVCAERTARAVCSHGDDHVFITDSAVFQMRECVGGFNNWHWANMNIDEDDWRGRLAQRVPAKGTPTTFCDLPFEYAKDVNASWLIASQPRFPGAPPPSLFPFNRAFHGHVDYGAIMDGNDTVWHDSLKRLVVDGYGPIVGGLALGQFVPRDVLINHVETFCTVYDWNEPLITPPGPCGVAGGCIAVGKQPNFDSLPFRSTTFIHEGWHAWGEENFTSDYAKTLDPVSGHELAGLTAALAYIANSSNPAQPNFCSNTFECDHFRPHPSSEFGREGTLVDAGRKTEATTGADLNPRFTFHSVYQTEIEFECDVADYSPGFIPFSVREGMALLAKSDATGSVVEGVPFFCGSTRPFWTKDPGAISPNETPACLDQTRLDCGRGTNGNCGTLAGGCGTDGCCIPTCSSVSKQCKAFGSSGTTCPTGTECNVTSGCCDDLPQPLKVSASTLQVGLDICMHGEGFKPGAKVRVQYVGVPGLSFPVFAAFDADVGADGKFDLTDRSQEDPLSVCSGNEGDEPVEVDAVEVGSLHTAKGTLPAKLWCRGPFDVNGGCRLP